MSLFTLKYAPQNSAQILGQQLAVSQLKDFIVNYNTQKHKAAILVGEIGVGKTSSVYALAKELNYDVLEINSSDLRNAENIKSFLDAALGQQSLFFRPKLILIDEVDNISGIKDRGCIPAVVAAIEKSKFPIILTANEYEDSKLKPLRKTALQIDYHKLQYRTISHALELICQQENISYEEKAVHSLARQADGDMRAALLDLHSCAEGLTSDKVFNLSDRKRTESILNVLTVIFKSSTAKNALGSLDNVDLEIGEIFLWMDENLPKEYIKPNDLAKAYECLSRADVFNGRIKRQQHWRLMVYIYDLLTGGVSSAKEEKNPDFVAYRPTMRLLRIWQSNMKNSKKKQIAEKLAKATHTSQRVAESQVGYLQEIFRHSDAKAMAGELNLNNEEVEWLTR